MLDLLTKREKEIFEMACQNMNNKEIALKIDRSEHLVKKYLRNIYFKLGLESLEATTKHNVRREMMLKAKENGWVESEKSFTLQEIQKAAQNLFPDNRIQVVKELINFLTFERGK